MFSGDAQIDQDVGSAMISLTPTTRLRYRAVRNVEKTFILAWRIQKSAEVMGLQAEGVLVNRGKR